LIAYLDGWYGEEHDGPRFFRWMQPRACCRLDALPASEQRWLSVTAAPPPGDALPVLVVSANGRTVGSRTVRPGTSRYLFPLDPLGASGEAKVGLEVDRCFTPPGDPRSLGLMVRDIDVVNLAALDTPLFAEGWHELEEHEYFAFRWMGLESRVLLPAHLRRSRRFLALPVCTELEDASQTLTLLASDAAGPQAGPPRVLAEIPLLHHWHVYQLPLAPAARAAGTETPAGPEPLDLTLRLDRLLPVRLHPSDPRDLGVRVGTPELHDDARRYSRFRAFYDFLRSGTVGGGAETRQPVESPDDPAPRIGQPAQNEDEGDPLPAGGEGWHPWEFQEHIPFRWMKREARVVLTGRRRRGRRYITMPVFSEFDDLSQVLTISAGDKKVASWPLVYKWASYSCALPSADAGDLDLIFRLNKVVPPEYHPMEPRELGIHVGPLGLHDDESRHERARFVYENAVTNQRELESGATLLSSFPLNLGIDVYGRCNIKPPCVYCMWGPMKALEGDAADAVVDERTLEQYGPFFSAARSLLNCSFGEPLLHPRLEAMLDLLARADKTAELSTNGQAFTPRTVRALAGRRLFLYVSLDAASRETYARLRNDRWDDVVTGLMCLREARRRAAGLPKLFVVFIPMRANLQDLEACFKLCRMVDANALALRPLLYQVGTGMAADRGGYHYDYDRELLGRDETHAVLKDAARYAGQYGVHLLNQFDFGIERPAAT
jgi:MoaA/NifB/PqqE/SkfB family radical SAM enzyme